VPEQIKLENDCIDYIELNVTDIERAKAFYGGAFGWSFTDYGEDYCEFTDGRMKGGFSAADAVMLGGPMIVLYHKDLENAENKVMAAGGVRIGGLAQNVTGELCE